MAKTSSKTTKKNTKTTGEQLPLIEVGPKNLAEIAPIVRDYMETMHQRLEFLLREVGLKKEIQRLVAAAKLKRLSDGSIRFTCEGLIIKITPQDEKITVTEAKTPKDVG